MNNNSAVELKEFYDTVIGRVVQRAIRKKISKFWKDCKNDRVVGFGYALPYLSPFITDAERVVALMPKQYGVISWPSNNNGLVAVCGEEDWPLESNSVNRVIIAHSMNSEESLSAVLSEAWRVLTGQGKVIIIVPNRSGMWARVDNNPFGHGIPYSLRQVKGMLKEYMFVPEREERALFFPPSSSRILLATSGIWEQAGDNLFNAFGGVNIVEASKQLYAGTFADTMAVKMKNRKIVISNQPITTTSSDLFN